MIWDKATCDAAKAKANNMAWNYDTGQEDPTGAAQSGGVITPPAYLNSWPKSVRDLWVRWQLAESACATRSGTVDYGRLEQVAAKRWQELIEILLPVLNVQHSTYRHKFVLWLMSRIPDCDPNKKTSNPLGELDMSKVDENLPLMDRIVQEGFKAIAKRAHPDVGGSAEKFIELKQSTKQLQDLLKEVKDLL
jgi:hypothetical protein